MNKAAFANAHAKSPKDRRSAQLLLQAMVDRV
jgi:hypothetical protein